MTIFSKQGFLYNIDRFIAIQADLLQLIIAHQLSKRLPCLIGLFIFVTFSKIPMVVLVFYICLTISLHVIINIYDQINQIINFPNLLLQLHMDKKREDKHSPPKSENLKLKEKSYISDVTHFSKRSYQFQTTPTVKHLNLDTFKINPCNITKTHNHKHCTNYHNTKDRKRYGNFYHNQMCSYIKQEQKCPDGDNCLLAHSFVEQHYNYQKYKKQFCSHYPHSTSNCPYAEFCSYAHSQQQILATLIHNYAQDDDFYMFCYKTEFCPFNLTEHDKSKCVYAHNWQDYRRKPDIYIYQPIPCFNWKTKDYIYDYNSGCEIGSACNMCHGWKEQQYHPSFYKTAKCEAQGCKKGSCPNYHSQKERRIIEPTVISRAFKYVPKNRIVQGVFKNFQNKEGFKLKPQHKSKTLMQPRLLTAQQNDFKTKTLIAVKQRTSVQKPEKQWIKQIIDSEEESDEGENQIVASQVEVLKLDE